MNSKFALCFLTFVAVIMIVQLIPPAAEATHTGGRGSEARDKAESERKDRDVKEQAKDQANKQAIKAALADWKAKKAAVKTAKQAFITAKNSGDVDDIKAKKAALDAAKKTRDAAYKVYKDALDAAKKKK